MSKRPTMSHTVASGRTLKVSVSPGISHVLGYSSLLHPSASSNLSFPSLPLVPHDVHFNVVVGGQNFKLNYDQIMYDSPNIFTGAFLEVYSEGNTRTLNIPGRSPALFAVIYEYLSGYAILPNSNIDLRNLLSDCEYYGLQALKDELTLPKLGDALSTQHELIRVVRFEDVVSGQAQNIEWTPNGLMDAKEPSKHLLVFVTKVNFKLNITLSVNGERSHDSFAIELPSYAENLSSKLLDLGGQRGMDWTAVPAEALASTPLTLNDNEFEGNFGDLIHWVGSFMSEYISESAIDGGASRSILGLHDPDAIAKLSKALPRYAHAFRVSASQGHNILRFSTTLWASELSIIIAPPDDFDSTTSHMDSLPNENNLVAKILNCSLSTGLHRRKRVKALVNI